MGVNTFGRVSPIVLGGYGSQHLWEGEPWGVSLEGPQKVAIE
jgi:hypothetical protein